MIGLMSAPAPGETGRATMGGRRLSDFATGGAGPSPAATREGSAGPLSSDALLALVLATLDDNKAEEVVDIDLRGRSAFADHMVIASGRSSRQVASIAEKLTERLRQEARIPCKVEGKETGDWVLIDAGDVVVHLFRPEVRAFYQLEKMWQVPVGYNRAPGPAGAGSAAV
jgi:ribosome-associated protein